MIIVWGKTAGLALGSFGGLLGALFGILVGHLLDVVASGFLLRRLLSLAVRGTPKQRPHQFHLQTACTALTIAVCVPPHWRPSAEVRRAFEERVCPAIRRRRRITWELWHRLADRTVHRYLESAFVIRAQVSFQDLARLMGDHLGPESIRTVLKSAAETIAGHLHGPCAERFRELAELLHVESDWVGRFLVVPGHGLSPDDCAVLGIHPDATLHEVKRVYRSLASQFHPDTLSGLSGEQRSRSSAAFVKINEAYERVVSQLEP